MIESHIHLKNIHIWWQNMMEKFVGYAYVSPFKERAAYAWAVETSIYVDQNCKRMGIGKKLHSALEHCLKEMGILNMEACVGYPEEDDEYLTKNSAQFHEHLGYRRIGDLKNVVQVPSLVQYDMDGEDHWNS